MANKSAIKQVMEQFLTKLKADASIIAELGNGANSVFTVVPEKPTYPYIHLDEWTSGKHNTFNRSGKRIDARIWIYTRKKTKQDLTELLELVTTAIDDVDLTLTSFNHIYTQYKDEELMTGDRRETQLGILTFEVLVQEK